jgi:hypothetical protein
MKAHLTFTLSALFWKSRKERESNQSNEQGRQMIKPIFAVVAMMVASGCATKKIETQPLVSESLPRPNQILVYDFVATPDEVPADSTIAREFSIEPTRQTAEQIAFPSTHSLVPFQPGADYWSLVVPSDLIVG